MCVEIVPQRGIISDAPQRGRRSGTGIAMEDADRKARATGVRGLTSVEESSARNAEVSAEGPSQALDETPLTLRNKISCTMTFTIST